MMPSPFRVCFSSQPRLRRWIVALATVVATAVVLRGDATERRYLSGKGPKDAVTWEFTVTGGRRAGEKTTLPVPSQWELHGFGTYNYGQERTKADEHGLYRLRFHVPAEWKGRRVRLVFDGVMTDATVKVNGRQAGPLHHGGFYRFRHDITSLIKFGARAENENLLEVDVAKASSDPETDRAERGGDYWTFGGIYRPVWLECVPAHHIEHIAIDARADGTFIADVTLGDAPASSRPDAHTLVTERIRAQILDARGNAVGAPVDQELPAGGTGRIRISTKVDRPLLWTAETPHLYTVILYRLQGMERVHTVTQRFGFRTFEVRQGQGLFLNGRRILLKGINRHSFRPATGRALTAENNYADVRLIREMNMNAVRTAHYPPDESFLEACDEMGLYVIDELSGWQRAHGTAIGRQLVREMVERDVNHPSILFWTNGNEGGWNRDLDSEFSLHDPQNRVVLHPWDPFNGVDTKHYPAFDDLLKRLRGRNVVLPTEFVHALYDGGGGAQFEDTWNAIAASPVGGGGFIWVLSDEGVVRSDQNGRIDVFGTYGPDGLVGPNHEKEGSFYTVRDIWSPVQIDRPSLDNAFDGQLTVHNRYDFTSLADCRFRWKLIRFPSPTLSSAAAVNVRVSARDQNRASSREELLVQGEASSLALAPQATGKLKLNLPPDWRRADALVLTALDSGQRELWTWVWSTADFVGRAKTVETPIAGPAVELQTSPGEIILRAGDVSASFDSTTGMLSAFSTLKRRSTLTQGPRVVFARPPSTAEPAWRAAAPSATNPGTYTLAKSEPANTIEVEFADSREKAYSRFTLEVTRDGGRWTTLFDGARRPNDGLRYEFPPQMVAAARVSRAEHSDGSPASIKSLRIGYSEARFPEKTKEALDLKSGRSAEGNAAWLEGEGTGSLQRLKWSLNQDGALRLSLRYRLQGDYAYHGVTFDAAWEKDCTLRWLGDGPYRVWQNRRRGTWLGVHEKHVHRVTPGESWNYPEFEGYHAGLRWADLQTGGGRLAIQNAGEDLYLRIGTPLISHQHTTVDFPPGDLSFLHAIPPIGTKFKAPEQAVPSSRWSQAQGDYEMDLVFRLGD